MHTMMPGSVLHCLSHHAGGTQMLVQDRPLSSAGLPMLVRLPVGLCLCQAPVASEVAYVPCATRVAMASIRVLLIAKRPQAT